MHPPDYADDSRHDCSECGTSEYVADLQTCEFCRRQGVIVRLCSECVQDADGRNACPDCFAERYHTVSYICRHGTQWAVMHLGQPVGTYDSAREAIVALRALPTYAVEASEWILSSDDVLRMVAA